MNTLTSTVILSIWESMFHQVVFIIWEETSVTISGSVYFSLPYSQDQSESVSVDHLEIVSCIGLLDMFCLPPYQFSSLSNYLLNLSHPISD